MNRRHIAFPCEGSTLIGTLDEAEGATGLLLASGGNELRAGAWNGQAMLAARIAAQGFPVFRFDRRGVGDSDGPNGEFRTSAPDIAAALAAFRKAAPHVTRFVGLGNCDAASALMLARGKGLDALILSNPWTIETPDDAPPPEAIRSHYRQRLADPAALLRLLRGKVSFGKLLASLRDAMRPAPPPSSLARDMAAGIADFTGPVTFLIAGRDRTGQAFLSAWRRDNARVHTCPAATHSFVEAEAREWLAGKVLEALRD